jgi:hypothetical protein
LQQKEQVEKSEENFYGVLGIRNSKGGSRELPLTKFEAKVVPTLCNTGPSQSNLL